MQGITQQQLRQLGCEVFFPRQKEAGAGIRHIAENVKKAKQCLKKKLLWILKTQTWEKNKTAHTYIFITTF